MTTLTGKVIKGEGYGRKLGYPTANIDRRQFVRDSLQIKLGIWSGVVKLIVKGKFLQVFKTAVVVGPIDTKGLPKIEAHLIGFKGNLYGRKIEITLHKHIRPFKNFRSEKDLITQIEKDIKTVKSL